MHNDDQGVDLQDHRHDIVHDLSRRLGSLGRYDRYLANAAAQPDLRAFWLKIKDQETEILAELNGLIERHVRQPWPNL